MFKTIGEAGLF